jgi:predicted nucleotidyltransferase
VGHEVTGLGSALFGKSRLAILCLLYLNAERRYYLRQIVNTTQLGMGAIQRELRLLANAGLILREREGRQVYYHANRECPIFEELKAILVKTAGLADVLRDRLRFLADRCRVAFIYGSFAQGTDNTESDVDVVVIGNVTFAEVSDALGDLQSDLGREVNPTVYGAVEFKKKTSTPFVASILRKPKVFLIGDENELARLAR